MADRPSPAPLITPAARSTRPFAVPRKRCGVAAVEFAVVLPLILLLVLGAIEVGRGIMVRHALVRAARAGCRMYAVKKELTQDDARAMIDRIMTDAGLAGHTVEFDPSTTGAIGHLAPVRVSVSIPYDRVAWSGGNRFLGGRTLSATCVMPGDDN